MFDSAIKHRAVSQTNSDRRIVINLKLQCTGLNIPVFMTTLMNYKTS